MLKSKSKDMEKLRKEIEERIIELQEILKKMHPKLHPFKYHRFKGKFEEAKRIYENISNEQ